MKKHVVIYTCNPGPRDERVIHSVFGPDTALDPVLPFVSEPLDLQEADALMTRLTDAGVVIIQPSPSEVAVMDVDDALKLLRRDSAWTELLQFYEVDAPDSIETREFPRCWLILVRAAAAGMPPGEGFVVDKYSRRVFPRRYIDVAKRMKDCD